MATNENTNRREEDERKIVHIIGRARTQNNGRINRERDLNVCSSEAADQNKIEIKKRAKDRVEATISLRVDFGAPCYRIIQRMSGGSAAMHGHK